MIITLIILDFLFKKNLQFFFKPQDVKNHVEEEGHSVNRSFF